MCLHRIYEVGAEVELTGNLRNEMCYAVPGSRVSGSTEWVDQRDVL